MAALMRRSPTRAMVLEPVFQPARLFKEIESMFREIDTGMITSMDMYQEGNDLVIKAELPGIKKEDIDVSIEEETLTIKAEKKADKVSEGAKYYTCERSFGSSCRSVSLPFHVDPERASALFSDGILEIRLPVAEQPEKTRHIEVKVK